MAPSSRLPTACSTMPFKPGMSGHRHWDPSCNVFEAEDGFTVQIALPGLDPGQIDVKVENNVLSVKGGRPVDQSDGRKWYARGIQAGPFSCSFRLPDYADHENCAASYRHGLLTITFPKREEAKPPQIMIQCQ
jgi:HSP20 family protein